MTNLFQKPKLDTTENSIFDPEESVLDLAESGQLSSDEQKSAIATLSQKISQRWRNLSFGRKLSLLIISGVTIPVIAVTQGILQVEKKQAENYLLQILDRDLIALESALNELTNELSSEAEIIASFMQNIQIDPNNSNNKNQLEKLLGEKTEESPDESFYIITDPQGKTVTQFIQTIDEDFSKYSSLPEAKDFDQEEEEEEQKFRPLSIPTGVNLGQIPIVKNALQKGQQLSGYELIKSPQLQLLGLAPQANIGVRSQKIEGLPEPKQPYPENTFDIDGGKIGLVAMSVAPIKINDQIVGTVIFGTLINRNYEIVDEINEQNNVATATIFAQDWRVSTNVPYVDKQTRAIGTRVSREVADMVLNKQEHFVGQANIIGIEYLTAYAPIYDHQKQFDENAKPVGIAYVGEPTTSFQKARFAILLTGYGIGGVVALGAILIATRLANSFAKPVQDLATFARKIGSGESGLRLQTSDRTDEIGILTQEMNQMVITQENNEELLRLEARRASILKDISVSISRCANYHEIIGLAVEETRRLLETDRVIVYIFDEKWQGTIIAESVGTDWPIALNAKIHDPCFADRYVNQYQEGRVKATPNIYQAGLTKCHLQQLEPFAVKANLVAPIIVNNQLTGLFIAHQCSDFRQWQQGEIDLFAQIATQVGFALDRNDLLEQQKQGEQQQRQEKETLQRRALELLMQVDPVSRGDLTIRAQVTADEIGTVADSYNSTIESLRKIVGKVQEAALEVAETTNTNDDYIQSLSKRAIKQTKQIQAALNRVQLLAESINLIAQNAAEAEQAAQQAAEIVTTGDEAMNRTVESIITIRETVAETAKKVKRLGESSQKISKVVNLINGFTDQTNLLALNASIEAAHAGEEGRGFAVVADEVRNLAQQSMEATAEITKLVKDIQTETNEVVAAMEAGTEQVVTGTKLVNETRQNLTQITEVSARINQLVEAIASTTVEQSKDSEIVSKTMTEVAKNAQENSISATEVLHSFKELLTVSQELQATVAKFKVN
jgi:methyl-accepting chemotaxis protein PixJ